QGHGAGELTVDVPRLPYFASRQLQAQSRVGHQLTGRISARYCRRKYEWLECAARLTPHLRRPIEARMREVAAAHERTDVARRSLHQHERTLQIIRGARHAAGRVALSF